MARISIYVLSNQGAWKIQVGDKITGNHSTQKEAIKATIDTAHSYGKNGRAMESRVDIRQ